MKQGFFLCTWTASSCNSLCCWKEKILLSLLNCPCIFKKNISLHGLFWILNFFLLVCLSLFPTSYCCHYCSFLEVLKSDDVQSFNFIFVFQIILTSHSLLSTGNLEFESFNPCTVKYFNEYVYILIKKSVISEKRLCQVLIPLLIYHNSGKSSKCLSSANFKICVKRFV